MSKNNLELLEWGDGTTRLTYWDNLQGEDISFILNDDGNVYIEDPSDDKCVIRIYDFTNRLRELVNKINT